MAAAWPDGKPAKETAPGRAGNDGTLSSAASEVDASVPDGDAGDSTNVWPDAAAEEIFLTETGSQTADAAPALATEAMEETDAQGLPPLDELVKRIPGEVREALDDLFRVKYTTVRRVPKKALKAQ